MQAAVDYFSNLGWTVVGNPSAINLNWNGADLVFTMGKGSNMRVLAVELKNVAGNINLGTLGKSATGDYGGSISRFIRSAGRFQNSSAAQLRLMSQTVLQGAKSGTLENALFTTSNRVSAGAQAQFNGVYRLGQNGEVIVDKAISGRSFLQGARDALSSTWSSVKSAASSAWDSVKSKGGQIAPLLSGAVRSLSVTLNSTETSVGFPVPLPGFIFDPTNPYSPLYNPAFQRCVD
jgi:hypothetical protein